jgi:hypothetical protein
MCMACEMEAVWFAAMEARARAVAPEADEPATLPPPPERGRDGEGVVGGITSASVGGVESKSGDPLPNPPAEEGGGGAPSATPLGYDSQRSSRFSCEETQAE